MGGLSQAEVELLVGLARDASHGVSFHTRFQALCRALVLLVPAARVNAMILDATGGAPQDLQLFENSDPADLEAYVLRYRRADPMGHMIVAAADAAPVLLSDFIPDARFGRDAFTGDFLPSVGTRFIMGWSARLSEGYFLALGLHREPGQPDFSPRERRLLELAGPDLARAAQGTLLRMKLAGLMARSVTEFDPETVSAGGVVFDGRGGLLHVEPGALVILSRMEAAGRNPIEQLARDAARLSAAGVREGACLERFHPLDAQAIVRARHAALEGRVGTPIFTVLEVLRPPARDPFEEVAAAAGLTPREREVVRLAAQDLTQQAIAGRLGLAPSTVRFHLVNAYRKLRVNSRTGLVGVLTSGRLPEL